jgi:hypothetical protein
MFHVAAYTLNNTSGAAETLADVPVVTDTVLATRNNHLIFTDAFNLGLAYAMSQTATVFQLNDPTLNQWGHHQIWPFDNPAATPPTVADRPALVDYLSSPLAMPMNEEIAWQWSNTATTAERADIFVWLFTPNHVLTLPSGIQRIVVPFTTTFNAGTAFVWTGPQPVTFGQNLRGGWYVVVGFAFEAAGVPLARLYFPRALPYNGRILRPGVLGQQAYGNRPDPRFGGRIGVYGAFHSFEPLLVEWIPNATGSLTLNCVIDVIYVGDTPPAGYVQPGGGS